MASGSTKDVNRFIGNREHARGHADDSAHPLRPYLSPGPPPRVPVHGVQQQGPKFRPNPDIAVRRQLTRQDIGNELRIVGPPIILNPEELPLKNRSTTTLIKKAQHVMHKNPAEDIAALASQVASYQPFATKQQPPRGTFDDSASIMTSDTDYVDHGGNYTYHSAAVATDYNKRDPASNPNLKHVGSDHANQMRGQIVEEQEEEDYDEQNYAREYSPENENILDGWQAAVAEEKAYRGITPGYGEPAKGLDNFAGATHYEQAGYPESSIDFNDNDEDIDEDEAPGSPSHDWVARGEAGARTPTQQKATIDKTSYLSQAPAERVFDGIAEKGKTKKALAKGRAPHTGVAEPSTKDALDAKPTNQAQRNNVTSDMAPPSKPASANKNPSKGKHATRNADLSIPLRSATPPNTHGDTKATSFGSSSPSQTSEDELTMPNCIAPTAHKRNFEESLYYTREQLAGMSYSDLDTKLLLTDPNDQPRELARDQHGVDLTLEQKLSKMTDMSEDQCKAMFATMSDAENEGTSQWFMAKMKEDMEKLMRAKHNRRMIAAKYEHEVKKRNAMVAAKTKDVDDELEGLKSGLGNLMPKGDENKAEKKAATKKNGKIRK